MRKILCILAAALIPVPSAAQSASSTFVVVTPGGADSPATSGINGQDSRRNGQAPGGENAPSDTPIFGSNEYCPPGKVWGEPYGVLYCLSTSERCNSEYLTWTSVDGRSLCKAYAPAISAIKVRPLIKYRGVEVSVCPDGSSRADCIETVQTTQSPPITLNANAQVSSGVGSAAASCISGAWSISSTTCAGGGSTIEQPCAAAPVSWASGGVTCSTNAPAGTSGQAITLTDPVGPATGSVQAVCIGGAWGGLTGQTCSTPIPNCPAVLKSWGSYCSTTLPETASGSSRNVTGSGGNYSGSATYTCESGAWTGPAGATCSAKCYSQGGEWRWQQGGAICSGMLPSGYISPGAITVTDNVTNGSTDLATGTYSVTCKSDGTWDQANQSINCTAKCAADGSLQSWMASNGQVCRGYLPAAPVSAGTYTLPSLPGDLNTGSYKATCKSDGVWDMASVVATCAPPCAAIPGGAWTVGGATCNGDVPATKPGLNVTITDSTAPTTGTFVGQCLSTGEWNPVEISKTCSTKCTSPGGVIPGGAPYQNCAYTVPGGQVNQGGTITGVDSVGPYTGSATMRCEASGEFSLVSATCAATCMSPGGVANIGQCSYAYPAYGTNFTAGQSPIIYDNVAPYTGQTQVTCDSTGNWTWNGVYTCSAPACYGQTVYWSSCYGSVGYQPHGGNAYPSNSAANYAGSATFTCSAGAWSYAGGSCSYVAPPPKCYSPGGTVSLGNCVYVYPAAGTAYNVGQTATVSDSTLPWRGSSSFICQAGGNWGWSGSATCY